MVLVGQLGQNQAALIWREVRQHDGNGFVPPVQAAQIGLLARIVESCQMHAGQHVAHAGAMRSAGREFAVAPQLVDHGSRLAFEAMQDVAFAVLHRIGHGNAARCQMLHQVQVKRQLLERQAFKQRQHVLALIGIYKIVGVFDAACSALDGLQLPQI